MQEARLLLLGARHMQVTTRVLNLLSLQYRDDTCEGTEKGQLHGKCVPEGSSLPYYM